MAQQDKKDPKLEFIQSANSAGKQARNKFTYDLNRRLGDQAEILTADDMSGLYDPERRLFTTIDGSPRLLTLDDIAAFKAAVKDVQRRHGLQKNGKGVHGGILPKQVIDLSRPQDRRRAEKEIHFAVPVSNRAGVVHFQTNAGPNYGAVRHHVMVQFLGYDSALADGDSSKNAAKVMMRSKIKFDCDCGRHTFWYRYIATIGNFNFGRAEDGFPKIRNPTMYGVGCKHVLRVMQTISHGPAFHNFATRMIENGRKVLSNQRQIVTVADQLAFVEKAKGVRSRDRKLTTSGERREMRNGTPSAQAKAAARIKAASDSLRKSHAAKVNKPVSEDKKIKVLMGLGYSRDAALAAIAAADKAQG